MKMTEEERDEYKDNMNAVHVSIGVIAEALGNAEKIFIADKEDEVAHGFRSLLTALDAFIMLAKTFREDKDIDNAYRLKKRINDYWDSITRKKDEDPYKDKNPYVVTECAREMGIFPSTWKGKTECGKDIFIKFRFGWVTVYVGDEECYLLNARRDYGGEMSNDEMIILVQKLLTFKCEING